MEYTLTKILLLWDELSPRQIPTYDMDKKKTLLVYNHDTENHEEITIEDDLILTVPLSTKEFDEERVLFEMLIEASKNRVFKEWGDLSSTGFTKIIMHSSKKHHKDTVAKYVDIYYSDFCPVDDMLFLPPPQFLGVLVERKTQDSVLEKGMSIVNPEKVWRMKVQHSSQIPNFLVKH